LKKVTDVASTPVYHLAINIYKLEPTGTYTDNGNIYTSFKLG